MTLGEFYKDQKQSPQEELSLVGEEAFEQTEKIIKRASRSSGDPYRALLQLVVIKLSEISEALQLAVSPTPQAYLSPGELADLRAANDAFEGKQEKEKQEEPDWHKFKVVDCKIKTAEVPGGTVPSVVADGSGIVAKSETATDQVDAAATVRVPEPEQVEGQADGE